jgi:hypothetical protein
MKEKFDFEKNLKLKRIAPTNALWPILGPTPCEIQTALIRMQTLTCMEENDTRAATYRYLENQQKEINTRRQAIVYGSFYLYSVCSFISNCLVSQPESQMEKKFDKITLALTGLNSLLHMILFLFVPPAVCNTLRYRETKNLCKSWLTQKLGGEVVQKIEKLSYNSAGFFKVDKLLDKKEIPPASWLNIPFAIRKTRV